MWDIFLTTGDIGAYLIYRQCLDRLSLERSDQE